MIVFIQSHLTAKRFGNVPGEIKSESQSRLKAVNLFELFKKVCPLVLRNAHTCIGNGKHNMPVVPRTCKLNKPFGGVFYCIGKEMLQNLPQAHGIGAHGVTVIEACDKAHIDIIIHFAQRCHIER